MAQRFLLDTNIFVYTFDPKASAKNKKARDLVRHALTSREGVVSYQVVQEFFNVALRRFSQPMTVSEAEQYLISVFRPLLAVDSSPALFLEAMRLSRRYHFAWYDSLIVASALAAECKVLYSEDLRHGQEIETLRILNPFL